MQSTRAGSGRERAYAYLRERLLEDPSLAGTFVNEHEVAEQVGVSRTPVREALLLLAAEELVQLLPHRGAFIPALTPEEIGHVLDAREVIEAWAVATTLAAGSAPVADMAASLTAQRDTLDPAGFIRVDREFHTRLVEAAGNPVMAKLYESLRTRHVPIGVAAVEKDPRRRDAVLDEHAAIVAALAGGDPARAEAAVRDHLAATRRMLIGER